MSQHCQRCGALLPDQAEGICEVCGTPFGARTVAMQVSVADLAAEHARRQAPGAPAPAPAATPRAPADPFMTPALMRGLVTAVLVLIVGLALLLWTMVRSSPAAGFGP
jgi:hypothetical protein